MGETLVESMITVSLRRALGKALLPAAPEDIRHRGNGPLAEAAVLGER